MTAIDRAGMGGSSGTLIDGMGTMYAPTGVGCMIAGAETGRVGRESEGPCHQGRSAPCDVLKVPGPGAGAGAHSTPIREHSAISRPYLVNGTSALRAL
jgi:hypothetical protein